MESEVKRRVVMWKFPLSMSRCEIQMPFGAEVAHFDFQGDMPCIWAIVNPHLMTEGRTFQVFGTGHDLPVDSCCYVGTQQVGAFVWHLFEILTEPSTVNGDAP